MRRVDPESLARATAELGDVIVDPTLWVQQMEKICEAVNGIGAALLGVSGAPHEIPQTPSIAEHFRAYVESGWHVRDLRAERGAPRIVSGERVLIDQDLVTADEVRSTEYYRFLRSLGAGWFAGIAAWAGSAPWMLAIHRAARQSPFEPDEKRALELLSAHLSEVATLSKAVGAVALSSANGALNAVHRAAVAIGRNGRVLDANPAAHALFDRHVYIGNGELQFADPRARAQLDQAIEAVRAAPDRRPFGIDPIVVARGNVPPVVARVLSIPAAARNPFLGARALVTLTPIEARPGPSMAALQRIFGLTPAEARLASLLADGTTLDEAREVLGVGRETARTQLKAVFGKLGVHRQAALVALLLSLPI